MIRYTIILLLLVSIHGQEMGLFDDSEAIEDDRVYCTTDSGFPGFCTIYYNCSEPNIKEYSSNVFNTVQDQCRGAFKFSYLYVCCKDI